MNTTGRWRASAVSNLSSSPNTRAWFDGSASEPASGSAPSSGHSRESCRRSPAVKTSAARSRWSTERSALTTAA